MSPIKWLNYILFLENLQGVYRNYCNQSKIKKCFIIFQVFTQLTICSIVFIGQMKLLLAGDKFGHINLIFAYSTISAYINSYLSIAISFCYSCSFMSLYRSIIRVSEFLKDDNKFLNSQNRVYWFSLSLYFSYIAFTVYRSVWITELFSQTKPFYSAITLVSQTIMRSIVVFQQITMFIFVMMVVYSFKSLNFLISVVQVTVEKNEIISNEQCGLIRQQIQDWVELYGDITNCCEKVTLCFGRQVFLSFASFLLYLIFFTYTTCSNISLQSNEIYGFKKVVFLTCSLISLMMLLIVAGQMTFNQRMNVHKILARLYNSIIKDSQQAEAKLVKDFIRLIKENPVEIKLLPNFPIRMYMVPVLVTFVVNNLIVLLQFNHVI